MIRELLPQDFQERARQTKALQRARGVRDAETLLRILMLHIAGGLSLEQTTLRAAELGWAKISAVALFKRLRAARGWLESLCAAVLDARTSTTPAPWPLPGRTFRALDASDIREPGATGSSWRLHYSITLPGLRCDFAAFTTYRQGERLQNFRVSPGDVVLADRAYGKRAQIAWLLEAGADALIRLHPPAFPVQGEESGETDLPLNWLERLDTLGETEPGEWPVRFTHEKKSHTVRACAVRKSRTAAAHARHQIEVEGRKKGRVPRAQTLALADFVVVLTTLPKTDLGTAQVLELYRRRWQVELAFKRLKSLLDMSAVTKTDEHCARSWLQGKLLEALLIERLLEQSRAFFPWGYALRGG